MADNPRVNGVPVLTDEIAIRDGLSLEVPAQAQEIKLGYGPDGVFNSFDLSQLLTAIAATSTDATLTAFKSANHTDLAVLATTLASILAKIANDPSTGAGQLAQGTKLDTLHADLASLLSKVSSDPATQTTLAAFVAANHTDLSALLTKLNGTLTTSISNFPGTQTISGTVAVSNPTADPETGLAKDTTLGTGFGADGASPPAITGTGVRGWLRGIYEKLAGTLTVTGPATDAQLRASPLPVTGTVTATVDETTLAKDATLTTLVGGPGTGVATITGSGSGIQGLLRMIWDTLRGSIAVTGTFWQATQPVSATTLPLPTGAATDAKSEAIRALLAGTLVVDSIAPLVTAWTYFSTSDARNGLSQTYTETRASDSKSRTVTLTRDTTTGAPLTQSATAWA